MDKFERRRKRVRRKMQEENIEYILISGAFNRFYLSGFELGDPQCNESAGYLLLGQDEACIFTDPRYEQAAVKCMSDKNVVVYRQNKYAVLAEYLKRNNIEKLFFEPEHMSCATYFKFEEQNIALAPADRLFVEKIRMIKEEDEIAALETSCALNHKVFKQIEEFLRPGISEKELAWEVERLYRQQGAEALSFPTIAAFGPNAALPHAVPGDIRLEDNNIVLLDMGCRLNDYCSDQTRTFYVGSEDQEFNRVKDRVIKAQKSAVRQIKPEMEIKDAYFIARDYFKEYGVDEYFTHALGHGIGLETHEPPSISPVAKGRFEAGMVVTVEPGLYYNGWGGVRWENMICVEEHGARIL
ncbi:MAG: M24 family metallopeptidase [Thermodesulfobacteriota bacterium]